MKTMDPMKVEVKEIDNLLNLDPYLKPFEREIRRRWVKGRSTVESAYKEYMSI